MSVSINAIKNYSIEWSDEEYGHLIKFQNGIEQDTVDTDWGTVSVIKVLDFMYHHIPEVNCYDLLPSFRDVFLEGTNDKDDLNKLDSLMEPSECVRLFDEYNIIKRAKEDSESPLENLLWLYDHWNAGYKIYRDLD